MGDTIFSRIIRREIPADIVHEDDEVLGFRDVSPQAPTHVLFIPKREIPTLNDLRPDDATLVGKLVMAAAAARAIPAEVVARVVADALIAARPRARYLVGKDARFRAMLKWILPDRAQDRLLAWFLGLPHRG